MVNKCIPRLSYLLDGSCVGRFHPGPDQLESDLSAGQLGVPHATGAEDCAARRDREDVRQGTVAEGA